MKGLSLPRRTKALHRTTTLTLPGSSFMGGGDMSAYASAERIDGADAVVCNGENMANSKISSRR